MFKDHAEEMKKRRQCTEEALAKETASAQMFVVAQSKIKAFETDKDVFTKSADVRGSGGEERQQVPACGLNKSRLML